MDAATFLLVMVTFAGYATLGFCLDKPRKPRR